jgi:hypothetical protein
MVGFHRHGSVASRRPASRWQRFGDTTQPTLRLEATKEDRMSSYPYPQTKGADRPRKPCADCNMSDFDSHNCEVEGITAESEYLKPHKVTFAARRKAFDTARTAYDTTRDEVGADLKQIKDKLRRLREQLECQLDDKGRRCLHDAWHEVKGQLEKCGGESGCCVTEEQCDFGYQLGDEPTAPGIRALLEDFERRTKAAEACFDDVLVKEPDELKARVATLKTFVDEIDAAVANPKTTDYSRPFAQLLWAEHRRRTVWLGFDDPTEYVNCLCLALNCSLNGRRALAKLTGMLATLDCRDRETAGRCAWLESHVVEEILAACQRICPPRTEETPSQSSE